MKQDTRNYGKDHPRFALFFAEGGGVGDDYNTDVGDDEEKFQEWKARHAPHDSGEDYDLRGAYKDGLVPGADGHWDDKFKKPNHPTFSTFSKYAPAAPERAGTWDGEIYVPPKGD